MMKTIEITVKGRVQGVFFRQSTRDRAVELGLKGFVRNTASGDVFITVSGEETALADFIAWCHSGPPLARVDHIEVKEKDATEQFSKFDITA
jgi:acylphosphatase